MFNASFPRQKMLTKRFISSSVAELFSVKRHLSALRNANRILMYHSVGGQTIRDQFGLFDVSINLFHDHIKSLRDQEDFVFVDLPPINSGSLSHIAITFDDGYRDNLYNAAPFLARHGIPFTVFVSTKFVSRNDSNFLSPEELRILSEFPGAKIGSHGVTHRPLATCDKKTLVAELSDSKKYIEDITGKEIDRLSYPHGSVSPFVIKLASDIGYKYGATSYIGSIEPGFNPLALNRLSVLGIDTVRQLNQKVHGDWDWYRLWQSKNWR